MKPGIPSVREKIRNMPGTVKASAVFAFCGICQKGISFIVVPIYTRLMPTEAYGKYSIFLSWYQLLMVFTTLNMWNYLINNGLTKYGEKGWDFIAALQGLSTMITCVWIAVYIPFSGLWEKLTGLSLPMMALMFAELLVMPSFEYYCAVKRYYFQAGRVAALTLLTSLLIPVVSIPLILLMEDKGFAAILGRVLPSVLVYGCVSVLLLKRGRKLFDREYWMFALRFNLPLVPHFLSMMVLQQSDRIMIGRMCGEADAAVYSVAYQAGMALQLVNAAVLNVFVPYTYRVVKSGETKKVGRASLPLLALIGALNVFASLFAPEIIGLLASEEYHVATYAIPPVAMSSMYMFLFNLFANIEYYWGETKGVAVASVFSAITNMILNYIFIRKYGFLAAGYTTLVCYMLFSVCHYIFMRKVSRKYMAGSRVYDIRKILLIAGSFTVVGVGCTALYDRPVIRYALIGVGFMLGFIGRKKIIAVFRTMKG